MNSAAGKKSSLLALEQSALFGLNGEVDDEEASGHIARCWLCLSDLMFAYTMELPYSN